MFLAPLSTLDFAPQQVVSRQRSGAKERSKTVTISVHCFDARTVKLIFLLEQARQSRSKSPDPPPLELTDPPAGVPIKDKQQIGQRFFSFASSPKIGRRIIKSVSERVRGPRSGTLATDLSHSQRLVSNNKLWLYAGMCPVVAIFNPQSHLNMPYL